MQKTNQEEETKEYSAVELVIKKTDMQKYENNCSEAMRKLCALLLLTISLILSALHLHHFSQDMIQDFIILIKYNIVLLMILSKYIMMNRYHVY